MADRRRLPAVLLLLLLTLPGMLVANGGTLRFLGPLGPWEVAVFTDPTPVRPDSLDVSVLVTRSGSPRPVEGLTIHVEVQPEAGPAQRIAATREAADDPRYYAAKFRDTGFGELGVTVSVEGEEGEGGTASFTVVAREPGLMEHPLALFLLALLPLGLVGWWLLRSRSAGAGSREPEGRNSGGP